MSNINISDLTSATSINADDFLHIINGSQDAKITVAQLLESAYVKTDDICKSIDPDDVIADCNNAEFGKLYTIKPNSLNAPPVTNVNGVMIQFGMITSDGSGTWKFQLAFMATGQMCFRYNIYDTGFTSWGANSFSEI